ncbi:hypothetical protein [Winogradskyella haliclonae]|uniref:Adhesin domain-containing protein n=1 Tax=Winogradskyella haliclonae TaxID=2048558 RepID=A0ABQ2BXD1_9FLAO|nr:hypothetical protein [Winogradskyella haliclonae]GGI56510.1 hypothetical protein GCM10011444_08190 [Winogradskyella haliclonae]
MGNHINIFESWNTNFKTFLLGLLFLSPLLSLAQNKSEYLFEAKDISEVIVDGNQIFNISVKTKVVEDISVKSLSDGEYGNDYQVVSEVKNNQLFISLERVSLEKTPDDKRNAHKVIAATLQIKMPEHLNLSIKSDVGSVEAKGVFNELNINLFQGGCTINAIAKLATIKTIDGNIYVKTSNAIIETDSHHGLVDFPSNMLGFNVWRLTTNGGNIKVEKQE